MRVLEKTHKQGYFLMECPGCKIPHGIYTKEFESDVPKWEFNGDMEKPTFSPSLLVKFQYKDQDRVCHSFIRNGQWQFLNDCTHDLAGKTVDMTEVKE